MRKPGKVLSIIGLILSAALLVVGSIFHPAAFTELGKHMERAHRQRRGVLCLLCVPQKR